MRLVREIMMEATVKRSKLWMLIAQLPDGQWAGYFRHGIANDFHKKYTHKWAGSVSAHFHFHLTRKGLLMDGINRMIKGCFDYQAVKDAANAIQGKDGKVKSARQSMTEQVLADFDQKQKLVDNTLGMTHQQKEEYEREQAVQAKENKQLFYNFDEENSINPVEGRADDGTAFTTTQHVSLGASEYKMTHKDSRSELDEEGLLKKLFDDDENKGINMKMGRVHKTAGQREAFRESSEDDKDNKGSSRSGAGQNSNGGSSTQGKLGHDAGTEPKDAARGALASSLKRASLAADEAMQGTGDAPTDTAEDGSRAG
jgi:hypothetical protein